MFREERKESLPIELKETVVLDENTRHAIQTDELTKVVDNTITGTGQALVYHNIRNPSESVKEIRDKQEALKELRSNDNLRQGAISLLERVRSYENSASELFGGGFFSDTYSSQSDVRKILTSLPSWSTEIPDSESNYINDIKRDFQKLKGSPIEKLARGPIFRSLFGKDVYGLRELARNPRLVSPLPFHKFPIKITTTIPGAVLPGASMLYLVMPTINQGSAEEIVVLMTAPLMSLMGGWIGKMIGKTRDKRNFLGPMTERFANEPESQSAFRAIGRLDELVSYDKFGRDLKHACIPEVFDSLTHEFSAGNLINAVQSQRIEDYVPNDLALNNGMPLTFLTGPNSGGKTSLGKSITQAQDLAQAGCYVPADWAKMSVADRIFYQVGRNDTLEDDEGGLGTQFCQAKDILFSSTPRSLVVMDDLVEGTTFEEKTRHTKNQLYGLMHKGPTTIYITHHHELAREFKERGIGNYLQVEFDGQEPTHRIIPGISTNSHSNLVAARVGFDEKAIRQHLVDKGYIPKGKDLGDITGYERPSL